MTRPIDLDGQILLVTGGNTGLGFATAKAIALEGATTVITSRDRAKGERAVADIVALSGNPDVHLVILDLNDLASVRACAADFLQRFDRLDVLINNAGGVFSPRTETVDGFETTFGVNYLGHFLLTNLVLPRLLEAAPARVVTLSSWAHHLAPPLRFDDLQSTRRYISIVAYGRSKMAMALFARELSHRYSEHGITAYSVHPGSVRTRFAQDGDMPGWTAQFIGAFTVLTPDKGAEATIHCATEPGIERHSGAFIQRRFIGNVGPIKPVRVARRMRDDDTARRLWDLSAELVGLDGHPESQP